MISTETQYLYCMNDVGEILLLLHFHSNESDNIHIFNFNQVEFDITRIKYVLLTIH